MIPFFIDFLSSRFHFAVKTFPLIERETKNRQQNFGVILENQTRQHSNSVNSSEIGTHKLLNYHLVVFHFLKIFLVILSRKHQHIQKI